MHQRYPGRQPFVELARNAGNGWIGNRENADARRAQGARFGDRKSQSAGAPARIPRSRDDEDLPSGSDKPDSQSASHATHAKDRDLGLFASALLPTSGRSSDDAHLGSLGARIAHEGQAVRAHRYPDPIAGREVSRQNSLGQWTFDEALDGLSHRPRPEGGIETAGAKQMRDNFRRGHVLDALFALQPA